MNVRRNFRRATREVLRAHLEGCVKDAFADGSEEEKDRKIAEILGAMDSLSR